jgi:peptidoglycan hydrolase FlgJ
MTMTAPISAISGNNDLRARLLAAGADAAALRGTPQTGDPEVRGKFQDFVAGTFYKTMLKAMRDTQRPPKYFHGGQAEQIFQGQFDQQIAEQMAREHGARFADPLFAAYARAANGAVSTTSHTTEAGHALDIAA